MSLSIKEEQTRASKTRALSQAMQEIGMKKALIVTIEEEETISLPEGTIQVVPAWKFFLEEHGWSKK